MNVHVARNWVAVLMVTFAAAVSFAGDTNSKNDVELSLKFSDEATAADTGLPAYPGSKPYKDADQSSSSANLGFSVPSFGIKVVAMNLETPEEPDRVAAFYMRALSKYGNVLDCSAGATDRHEAKPKKEESDALACDSNESTERNIVYKVGTKQNQRIVAIKPHGNGTRFSLVHLDIRE